MRKIWGISSAAVVAFGLLLAFATSASATTYCVPAFFAGCPDNGTNLVSTLSAAMSSNSNDGLPDEVLIAPGLYIEPADQQISASGSDPLKVRGAGRDETRIMSTISGNNFVALLNNRPGIEVSDLTIAGGLALGPGAGTIVQILEGKLTDVRIEVNSQGADGIALVGDNTLDGVVIEAAEGHTVDYGIRLNAAFPGHTTATDSRISAPVYGIQAVSNGAELELVRSWIERPSLAGLWIGRGSRVTLRNSVVTTMGEQAVILQPEAGTAEETKLTVESSTIYNAGAAEPALNINIPNSITAGDGIIDVSSSIIFGYDHTWNMNVPIGPGFADAVLNIDHSNFPPSAPETSTGNPNVADPSNINQDPLFRSPQDLRLSPGSPSIDTGNPASTLDLDFDSLPRPVDGDTNGSALPDQGAFEFQPTCETNPVLCPEPPVDKKAPKLSKLKFRYKRGRGGILRLRVSEAARVNVTLKPRPKKKRKVVRLRRKTTKAGPVIFKLGKNRLKPGRYRAVITATDKSGNRSKLARVVRAR